MNPQICCVGCSRRATVGGKLRPMVSAVLSGIHQPEPATLYVPDVAHAARSPRQFSSQLGDEQVHHLESSLVHAAIKVMEHHLPGDRPALAHAEQLQDLVFLAGEVHALAGHLRGPLVAIDHEVAEPDQRLGALPRAADDRVDASEKPVLAHGLADAAVAPMQRSLTLFSRPRGTPSIRIGVATLAARSERSTCKPDMSGSSAASRMMS